MLVVRDLRGVGGEPLEPGRQLPQQRPGEPVKVTGTAAQLVADPAGLSDEFLFVHVMLPALLSLSSTGARRLRSFRP